MDINKKDRVTLKSYFRKNLVPTESNFADLIDGMLVQKDDGIAKLPGDPLSIAAAGEAAGPQKLINFYGNLGDANPAWTLQLNPRSDQNDPATAKPGFSVSDGQGVSRLFIDQATGNVGVGTIQPAGRLDIAGLVRFGLDEGSSGSRSISFARDAGDEINAGKITYKGGFGKSLNIVGAGSSSSTRNIKLYDNVEVVGTLSVKGSPVYPKIMVYKNQIITNAGLNTAGEAIIPVGNDFSQVYCCYAMLQGYSLTKSFDLGSPHHWDGAIPQLVFVQVKSWDKDKVVVIGYCSESTANKDHNTEVDNSVMFTLVVIGLPK